MPNKFNNVRQNFSKGVLSPRLTTRVDLEGYRNALQNATNWIVSSQGGMLFREGMQHVSFAAANQNFRLFQFLRGGEINDLLIEVGPGVIRFWIDDGTPYVYEDNFTLLSDEADGELLTDEADGEFLSVGQVTATNPYELQDMGDLYFVNQDKYGVIFSARHPPLYITFEADGTIVTELLPKERIPEWAYNDLNSPQLLAALGSWRINFPTAWTTNPFSFVCYYNGVPGGTIITFDATTAATNAAAIDAQLTAAAVKQGYTTAFVTTPLAGSLLVYDVAVSGDNAGFEVKIVPFYGWQFLAGPSLPITQPTDGGDAVLEPAWSYPTWVLHNGVYYQCRRTHLSAADVPGPSDNEPGVSVGWELYWDDLGIGVPNGFDYQYPSGNAWADATIYSPQNRGFPQVGAFHQQRLIVMANKDNPTALYGSEIGRFQNFETGPNDDQPWIFILDSSDSPQIKWAVSDQQLLVGTSSGEWLVDGEPTITPTSVQATRQNAARSKLAKPAQVDKEIFYLEQGGRKLRMTRYQRENFSYTSINASVWMEHLIATDGIRRIVVQHVPETMMLMVTNTGDAVFFAYEVINGVAGASQLITDGFIYDTATYFSDTTDVDYLYFAVLRNGNWCIERMKYPTGKALVSLTDSGVVHLDGWKTGTVPANGIILGLDHLNGKEVALLVDDAWQIGTHTVNAGSLSTGHSSGTYAVGLLYEGQWQTMEIDENVRGSGLGAKRRWNHLNMRILNSALPRVYSQRDRDRTPSKPMGTAETVREGVQDIGVSHVGYGDGSIIVLQDRPYPSQVLAFFGEYQVEDR